MRRTGICLIGFLVAPLVLVGQSPTPMGCSKDANDWFSTAYKAARDSAAVPGGKPVDVTALLAMRTSRTRACAAQFSIAATSGPDLLPLAALYSSIGMDSLAQAAVDKRLAEPGLTEAARADALVAMISTLARPDTLAIARAEPYMARLDRMPAAMVTQKIDAHSRLNSEYRYLDVNSRIRQHSLAIIDLTRGMKAVPSTSRDPSGVRSFTVLIAYSDLAEVFGDMGHADSALAILRQALVDHPETTPSDADNIIAPEIERYALVGTLAPPLEAGHWLNAPPGTTAMDLRGKVTVVEFTAHWCIPCRNSYPAMAAMAAEFGRKGVRFVFTTQFYGYLGTRRNLDPPAELAADQEYFGTEHHIDFPIGVADQPPTPKAGERYVPNPNDARYKVGGIPQTVVIDRNGVIRRILVGWDTGNADRLPALLTALLAEKAARTTP